MRIIGALLVIGLGLFSLFGAPWIFQHITLPLSPSWQNLTPRQTAIYILVLRMIGVGGLIAGILLLFFGK